MAKTDGNKVASLGGNQIHRESGHPIQGRSEFSFTRSQEQEGQVGGSQLAGEARVWLEAWIRGR